MSLPSISQMSAVQLRIKSVSDSSAQSPALCERNEFAESVMATLLYKVRVDSYGGWQIRLCIYVLFMTGARVSEVLRLRHCDIDSMGLISIPSSKGSLSRVLSVDLSMFKPHLLPGSQSYIFCNLTRFTVYHKLKEWGCYLTKAGSTNKAVTHVCRNIYVYRMQRMGLSGDQLSNGLGHKSMKSRVYYERKIVK